MEKSENLLPDEPYDICRTLADAEDQARDRNRMVVTPTPYQLFLDIDSEDQFKLFETMWKHFVKSHGYEGSTFHKAYSPSGRAGRYHVTVTLVRPVNTLERVLLQSLLGSDPLREILGFRRFNDGSEPEAVTVFFEEDDNDAER